MDGHHSVRSTELGLQVYLPNFFSGLYVAKDKGEVQALTMGLSKVNTRVKIASHQP